MKSFILICLIFATVSSQDNKSLGCQLVWTYFTSGDPLPSNAVEAHNGKQFVARIKTEDDKFIGGSYILGERRALFPIQDDSVNNTFSPFNSFQMLTNPYDCTLSWPSFTQNLPFLVEIDPGFCVGRGYSVSTDEWIAGHVDPSLGNIEIVEEEDSVVLNQFQVLTSYSPGLVLTATNFHFKTDPYAGSLSSIGQESIVNWSEAEISKVTKHSKMLVESSSVSTTKETTSSKTYESGFDILIFGKTSKVEHTYKESVTETFTRTVETEILLEKEIYIPKFTAVTTCSSVVILDDFSSDFTARGVYSAKGMKPQGILDLLNGEGINGPTIVVGESGEEEVVVQIEGTFQGSLSMDTQFLAVPYGESCAAKQNALFQRRMNKIRNLYRNIE